MAMQKLNTEHNDLRRRLEEAEETIRAIRSGAVDAIVVEGTAGLQVYTLEAADRPYRVFVEQMSEGAATLHGDGTIVYCNRQLADLLKAPHGKLLGTPLRDCIQEEDWPLCEHLLSQAHMQSSEGEVRLRRADGGLVPVHLAFSVLAKDCGGMIGILVTDMTSRRHHEQLEKLVQERTDKLTQSQKRLRALAQEVNLAEQRERNRLAVELHDHLQQMLVLGRLKLGQAKRLAQAIPSCATLIHETGDVLSDALKYTRTLVAELSPPVLRDHGLPAGLRWLGTYMQKHNLTVAVTVSDEEAKLPEDQVVLLFQSVRELLINSAKHAGTGKATLRMERHSTHLRIEVSDEGVGFDPAAAAAASTLNEGISSKFGLFSIQERMRALGGSFDLQSGPGQGTTATLTLPLTAGSEGRPPRELGETADGKKMERDEVGTAHSATRSPLSTMEPSLIRVLLVDDHIMVRQGLRAVLDAYADLELVGEAGNGEEAVRLVDQLRPAVVVMDINMPKMDGIEATGKIKSRYPETIVIGLSVNAAKENEEAMKLAGAVQLMTKEAAMAELYGAIQGAVKT